MDEGKRKVWGWQEIRRGSDVLPDEGFLGHLRPAGDGDEVSVRVEGQRDDGEVEAHDVHAAVAGDAPHADLPE